LKFTKYFCKEICLFKSVCELWLQLLLLLLGDGEADRHILTAGGGDQPPPSAAAVVVRHLMLPVERLLEAAMIAPGGQQTPQNFEHKNKSNKLFKSL
jgi:hypothetical protein